jgi:hypothetical protein
MNGDYTWPPCRFSPLAGISNFIAALGVALLLSLRMVSEVTMTMRIDLFVELSLYGPGQKV